VAKNAERITTHMLLNDQLPATFESPVPSIFTQIDPINHRWLVELTFAKSLMPRHPALGTYLVKGKCWRSAGRDKWGNIHMPWSRSI
jgi:hypothetical protein